MSTGIEDVSGTLTRDWVQEGTPEPAGGGVPHLFWLARILAPEDILALIKI